MLHDLLYILLLPLGRQNSRKDISVCPRSLRDHIYPYLLPFCRSSPRPEFPFLDHDDHSDDVHSRGPSLGTAQVRGSSQFHRGEGPFHGESHRSGGGSSDMS